jgi:hypothetical protein
MLFMFAIGASTKLRLNVRVVALFKSSMLG